MTTASPSGRRPTRRHLRAWLIAACSLAVAATLVTVGLVVAPRAHSTDVRVTSAAAAADSARGALEQGTATQTRAGISTFVTPGGIRTTRDLRYASAPDGSALSLDVCTPLTSGPERPAVLLIHGGGWTHGDKGNVYYHAVCQWLATEGFVTFSADYTLGAQGRYPVAPDELRAAISWMREPATTTRYGFDPKRIGLVGGSAGGSLAALLATEGSGPTDRGTRVVALVDLSGPVDLTAQGQTLGRPGPGIQSLELGYLGCTTFANCPQAAEASAITHVDRSDPPTFIQGSQNDFVPHEQGEAFAAALTKAGVKNTVRIVPGNLHSIAELDAPSRSAVAGFLHRYLG